VERAAGGRRVEERSVLGGKALFCDCRGCRRQMLRGFLV
jgi:hypothetical protein